MRTAPIPVRAAVEADDVPRGLLERFRLRFRVLLTTYGGKGETLVLWTFVDKAEQNREEVTQSVGFGGCRREPICPRDGVNGSVVSHFQTVAGVRRM